MVKWSDMDGLDRRLVKALAKLGFAGPTKCQKESIPRALLGRDLLLKSSTGSGKTIAFLLPLVQRALIFKESNESKMKSVKCLILVPTKELAAQIQGVLTDLLYYCKDIITSAIINGESKLTPYDIMISTPKTILRFVNKKSIDLSECKYMAIDEADLVLSFGYEKDMISIASHMPRIYQSIIVSATLSPQVVVLKKKMLHDPEIIEVEDEVTDVNRLQQYYMEVSESEKFLVLLVFLKLSFIKGRGIIFVNNLNKCYRVKLFLQQFYLDAAVINSEVPLNCRVNIIREFNQGVFQYLIATEEHEEVINITTEKGGEREAEEKEKGDTGESEEDSDEEDKEDKKEAKVNAKGSKEMTKQTEMSYGVSRGVDFDGVSFILNFDFPQSLQSYEHRVGRTARNKLYGTALSFVLDPTAKLNHYKEFELLREIQSKQPMLTDDAAVANIESLITPYDPNAHTDEFDVGRQPKKLSLNMAELDGFRYRVEDTMRAVTNNAVSEFRAAELKREIMNSEGLKEYFQQNPDDFKVLHHDKTMAHPIRRKSHLGNIPSYLVPASMRTLPVAERKGKKRSRGSGNYLKKKLHDVKVSDPLSDTALLGVSHDQRRLSLQMNESTSNRKKWKQAHRKGEYSKGKKNKRKES